MYIPVHGQALIPYANDKTLDAMIRKEYHWDEQV